jgi:S-(hydroxymethyl)glutathione dehydrogenase / alcohol dehydrogenase
VKTTAAVLRRINEPLEIEELELPALAPGQVLVDMKFTGVCHSQLNEFRGRRGPDLYLPHTLGHEGSAVVAEVGEGVTHVSAGDHVVVSWLKGIGRDVGSTTYGGAQRINSGGVSTFMTRAVVSENRLTSIRKDMPLREAALLGCAIPTGAGIVYNALEVQPGENVVIFGVGGIGLSAVIAARAVGAGTIAAVDVIPMKLEHAQTFGATHLVDARGLAPAQILDKLKSAAAFDYSIEAAGRVETIELAIGAVRDGGTMCLAGNPPQGARFSVDPFDLIRGKKLIGTWGGETIPQRDIPRYVDLFLAGRLPLAKMITRVYRLENVNQAMLDLEEGRVVRALVDFT